MSGLNQAFSEMAAFTFRDQGSEVTSSIIGYNRFFEEMSKHGGIKTDVNGGDYISRGITLLENPTTTNYEGYGSFNTDASESSTFISVPWRNKAMVVTASGDELRRNNGKAKIKSLVELRTGVAKDTQANHMAVESMGDGAINSSIYGLSYWIQDNGLGSPGGVDSAQYRNWRNQFRELPGSNSATYAMLNDSMNKLYASCEFSGTKPDMWVMTNDFYHLYQSGLVNQIRYTDTKEAEGSKDSIRHLGAKVIRDINANFGANGERGYCLTMKHWELVEHPDGKWSDGGDRKPFNGDSVVRPFFWMGNNLCKSRRTQGVLLDAA